MTNNQTPQTNEEWVDDIYGIENEPGTVLLDEAKELFEKAFNQKDKAHKDEIKELLDSIPKEMHGGGNWRRILIQWEGECRDKYLT